MTRRNGALWTTWALAAALAGCGAEVAPGPQEPAAPKVLALSSYEASLGTLVEVYGEGFVPEDVGRTLLRFEGHFVTDDGQRVPVSLRTEARYVNPGTLRWERFGPFRVPFGPGDRVGRFEGTVGVEVELRDGGTVTGEAALPVTFVVAPSLVVEELQPTRASCAGPAKRALGGAPYRMSVRAIGFVPQSFTYTIASPALGLDTVVQVRHEALGQVDTVGERGDFRFPEVPPDMPYYYAQVVAEAVGTDGVTRRNVFAIGVRRPIEVYYNGNVRIAEFYAPQPVSGCIAGGEAGRDVTYSESRSESRRRRTAVSWNESWLRTHTVTEGSSRTVGLSETNGVGFATTDGELIRWELGGGVNGSIGLGEAAKLGFEAEFRRATQRSHQVENSVDRETGLTESETTTNTDAATEGLTVDRGGTLETEVSSTETISRDFGGTIIAGTYGVFYRQTLRLLRRGLIVTYNLCGEAQSVGDYDLTDWAWAPDLALGDQCPPLPPSNLPPAQCRIPPCDTAP